MAVVIKIQVIKTIFFGSLIIIGVLIFSYYPKNISAQQESPSVLYVPLIGITSVPTPLALPDGAGSVTYNYAVKNFLPEVPLINITVVDDSCSPVRFLNGDDNGDAKLDYNETWRYSCITKLSQTTNSTATATGNANGISATHKAFVTVVVGSKDPAPLVSVVNITKVAYPLSLPKEGGRITFTYKVNNPGAVPLTNVTVVDDKCDVLSGRLGDTNGNNLLDINEVWIYTCTTTLKQTTTNTVNVTAFANGLKAVSNDTITVKVDNSLAQAVPNFPNVGGQTGSDSNLKITTWAILSGILAVLIIFFILTRKKKFKKGKR